MTRRRKDETTIISVIEDETGIIDEEEDVEVDAYSSTPQEDQIKTLITGVQGVDTISTDDIYEDDNDVPSPNDDLSIDSILFEAVYWLIHVAILSFLSLKYSKSNFTL